MGDNTRLYCGDLLEEKVAQDPINRFHQQVRAPFVIALIEELQNVMQIDDSIFLAFDVFNITKKHSLQKE